MNSTNATPISHSALEHDSDTGREYLAGALCPECGPAVIVNASLECMAQYVRAPTSSGLPRDALIPDDGPWTNAVLTATCGVCGSEITLPGTGSPLDGA